jgi:peroxiredoxin
VLAISPERPEKLREAMAEHGYAYELLSDVDMHAARAFGISFRLSDAEYARYQGFGVELEERSGRAHHELPVPSVFVIDRAGIVRFAYSNPDYRIRIEADAVLAAARRF